jgi:ferritin-like metal-binding protein YciE
MKNRPRGWPLHHRGFSVENCELALYEAFAAVAAEAGDHQTEKIAREIQKQEKATADKLWDLIGPNARRSITVLTLERAS